jgi:hypothetical protein
MDAELSSGSSQKSSKESKISSCGSKNQIATEKKFLFCLSNAFVEIEKKYLFFLFFPKQVQKKIVQENFLLWPPF